MSRKKAGEEQIKDRLTESVRNQYEQKWYGKKRSKYGLVNYGSEKFPRYTKPQFLRVFAGYEFLENLLVIRPYIQKKYDIKLPFLELLLYLAPKSYFSYYDYFEMPKQFKYNRIQKLIDEGWISIFSNGKTKRETVYKLTKKSRTIIMDFYKLLAGEEQIPADKNPLLKPTGIDKMRSDLIKKLNFKGPSETKKSLFQKKEQL